MIEFPCRCGRYTFSVRLARAADPVQCPECRRLVDVPLLSELASIETDGLIKIGETRSPAPHDSLVREKKRTFTRDHFDAEGNAIDMRPTFDDVLDSHDPAIPHALPATGAADAGA